MLAILCLSSLCDTAFVRFICAACGFCPAVSHYVNLYIFLFSTIYWTSGCFQVLAIKKTMENLVLYSFLVCMG